MFLADYEIQDAIEQGHLVIQPWEPGHLQPVSIDIRLGNHFLVWTAPVRLIDPEHPPEMTPITISDHSTLTIAPGEMLLATTLERVEIPPDLVCFLEGKSSLGRLGLVIHQTAGIVDPGFQGQLTLEISVTGSSAMLLRPGMLIAQLMFARCEPANKPYGHPDLNSRYQYQVGAVPSRYNKFRVHLPSTERTKPPKLRWPF